MQIESQPASFIFFSYPRIFSISFFSLLLTCISFTAHPNLLPALPLFRSTTMAAVVTTTCPDLELIARGKVRDLYRVDANSLLFVATDRISAYDVIMNNVRGSEMSFELDRIPVILSYAM